MNKTWYAGILNKLPDNVTTFICNRLLNGFLRKYAIINVEGMENLNDLNEPVIFICNHLSNSDALVMNKVLGKQDVTFVAGIKLSKNKFTNLGIHVIKTIPIKPNSADKDAMSNIVNTVKSGNNVFIFPEGTRSRNGGLQEGKRGILLIQKLTKAKIVPIGIHGTEKMLPINDSGMDKEEFHRSKVYINIGKPIQIPERNKEENKKEYEEKAMNYVMKSIAQLLPEEYRGIYRDDKL